MFFFGVWDNSLGHELRNASGVRLYQGNPLLGSCPLDARQLDCVFTPRRPGEPEDIVELTYVHGWTIMAMWDRSMDKRYASNAAFLAEGHLTKDEMWAMAERVFPSICPRLKAFQARGKSS